MAITREVYISSLKNPTEHTRKDIPAIAYSYDSNGTPCAIAFSGRRNKPDLHYRFRNEQQRDAAINEYLDNMERREKERREENEQRRKFKTQLKPGDIMYNSWGYDQTNVSFYEVLEVIGDKTIMIQEIGTTCTEDARLQMQGTALPDVNHRHGEPMRKIVQPGERVSMDLGSSLAMWTGRPIWCSWYA